ncbi:MAG: glycine cleavage system protein GcvH [Actinomycetota bacterium]
MEYPNELRYTKEHEWADLDEENLVRVGISDFAQDALGDVVYVDLPDEGTEVRAGDAFGEVESTKSVSDLFSPVSGRVVARNTRLADAPQLVNEDPYGDGWMVIIEMSEPSELEALLEADAYRKLVEESQEA